MALMSMIQNIVVCVSGKKALSLSLSLSLSFRTSGELIHFQER